MATTTATATTTTSAEQRRIKELEAEVKELRERLAMCKIVAKMQRFSGDGDLKIGEATLWLWSLKLYFKLMNFKTDREKIDYAAAHLRGRAATWFRAVRRDIHTMDYFKKLFLATFEIVDAEQYAARELLHLRQGSTSVREYNSKFFALASLLPDDASDQYMVSLYIHGLDPEIQEHLFAEKLTTDLMTATAAALRKGHYLEAERLGEKSRESFNKKKKKIGSKSCWNCGSMDHLKRDCPTR